MSIRPVDMQVSVQRSTDVSKLQHNEIQRPDTMVHHASEQLRKDIHSLEQNVTQVSKSEDSAVDENARGQGGTSLKKKNKRENRENEKQKKEESSKLDIFDVSI